MELITFDIKNIFFGLLFYLSTCTSFQSSEPVEIEAPTSTDTVVSRYEPLSLLIRINKKENVEFTYIDQNSNRSVLPLQKNDVKSMGEVIREAIHRAGGKENLKISIDAEQEITSEKFTRLVEALRQEKIYKFKFVTTKE